MYSVSEQLFSHISIAKQRLRHLCGATKANEPCLPSPPRPRNMSTISSRRWMRLSRSILLRTVSSLKDQRALEGLRTSVQYPRRRCVKNSSSRNVSNSFVMLTWRTGQKPILAALAGPRTLQCCVMMWVSPICSEENSAIVFSTRVPHCYCFRSTSTDVHVLMSYCFPLVRLIP